MSRNVGRTDQLLRIILGLALIALAFVGPKSPLGWLGLIPLLTGVLGVCPVYALFGISSCGREEEITG